MPTIKQILSVFGIAVLATSVAGIVAFLNEVHLEISFDKLKDFRATDLASYAKLGAALKFEIETAGDKEFTAFWVDDDHGKLVVRKSDVSYKDFHFTNRIVGRLIDEDDKTAYAITGYYNDNRVVFSHRGPISGTGVYILDLFPIDDIPGLIYGGYTIFEDVPKSRNIGHAVRCPFIMVEEAIATNRFTSIDAVRKAFPFLNTACISFEMPIDLTAASTK
jgi:hypothetical protein